MREHIYVAVDIEKAGTKLIQYPVVSVGFVVANAHSVLAKKRFNLKVNWSSETEGGDFEERCLNEFWNKLPQDVINGCMIDVYSQSDGWNEIAKWIDNLEVLYPDDKYNIKFLTDNASFDIATIDYNLEKYVKRNPMRYSSTNKYRSVISADDMLDMAPDEYVKLVHDYINNLPDACHNHNPINDAYNIFLQYFNALQYKYKGTCETAKYMGSNEFWTAHPTSDAVISFYLHK